MDFPGNVNTVFAYLLAEVLQRRKLLITLTQSVGW